MVEITTRKTRLIDSLASTGDKLLNEAFEEFLSHDNPDETLLKKKLGCVLDNHDTAQQYIKDEYGDDDE